MAAITLPILKGTQASYDAIVTKDPGKIYLTVDTGNIFLGAIQLGGTDMGTVVQSIAFDDDTQKFTITYTDATVQVIDLVLESVIKDVAFDAATQVLTFTLVSGATTEISLAGLVDAYTGGTTSTAAVTVMDGVIKTDVTTVGEITDATLATAIPNAGAVAGLLVIGTF